MTMAIVTRCSSALSVRVSAYHPFFSQPPPSLPLLLPPSSPFSLQCPLLNISFCPPSQSGLEPGKTLVVVAFNPLAWARTEIVRIPVTTPSVIVTDSTHQPIPSQLIPELLPRPLVSSSSVSFSDSGTHSLPPPVPSAALPPVPPPLYTPYELLLGVLPMGVLCCWEDHDGRSSALRPPYPPPQVTDRQQPVAGKLRAVAEQQNCGGTAELWRNSRAVAEQQSCGGTAELWRNSRAVAEQQNCGGTAELWRNSRAVAEQQSCGGTAELWRNSRAVAEQQSCGGTAELWRNSRAVAEQQSCGGTAELWRNSRAVAEQQSCGGTAARQSAC
ncbi:unnamed protein product [Closterium sp. Yama58-4]|nr:unnamed protein product [Closterium sp. Yama58-4]